MTTTQARNRRNRIYAIIAVSIVLFIHFSAINTGYKACMRGNPLREVVFRNTQTHNAIDENVGNHKIEQTFRQNLNILVAPEAVDDQTGLVDCGHEYKYFYIIPAG